MKTCIRCFAGLRAVTVPVESLIDLLGSDTLAGAVIMDHDGSDPESHERIVQVRRLHKDLLILAAGHRSQRDRLHRLKLELDIFSYIPLPLDPFDLARRLNRLTDALLPNGSRI